MLIGHLRFHWRCFVAKYVLFLQKTPGREWEGQFCCIWGEFWHWFCLVGVSPQWSTNPLQTWRIRKCELCPTHICWTQQQWIHSHSAFQEVTPSANHMHNKLLYSHSLIIMNRLYFSWHCHSQLHLTSLVHDCQSEFIVRLEIIRLQRKSPSHQGDWCFCWIFLMFCKDYLLLSSFFKMCVCAFYFILFFFLLKAYVGPCICMDMLWP